MYLISLIFFIASKNVSWYKSSALSRSLVRCRQNEYISLPYKAIHCSSSWIVIFSSSRVHECKDFCLSPIHCNIFAFGSFNNKTHCLPKQWVYIKAYISNKLIPILCKIQHHHTHTEYRNYKRRESLEKRLKILSTHCHMKNHWHRYVTEYHLPKNSTYNCCNQKIK